MQAATRLRMQWSCQVSQDSHPASCHLLLHAVVVSSMQDSHACPYCKMPLDMTSAPLVVPMHADLLLHALHLAKFCIITLFE